jgi:hypothetical protein
LAVGKRAGIELWDLLDCKSAPFHAPYLTPDSGYMQPSHCEQLVFLANDRLLAYYADATALVWEMPPAAHTPPEARMTAKTWEELGDNDPRVAQRAVWALRADARAGVSALRRLSRVEPADEKLLIALYADLGSTTFAKREAAAKRLKGIGRGAELFLAKAVRTTGNSEERRRARQILDDLPSSGPMNADELRAARAVQAAELIGGDAAKALLVEWAKGDGTAILTREATAALERLR